LEKTGGIVVTIAVLELERARKYLAAFCRQRNSLSNSRAKWCLNDDSGGFLLCRAGEGGVTDILRLRLASHRWLLSVPVAGGWRAYPPRPEAEDIESVIDELEQAPLHVHWE
jgi:hypothetical protein